MEKKAFPRDIKFGETPKVYCGVHVRYSENLGEVTPFLYTFWVHGKVGRSTSHLGLVLKGEKERGDKSFGGDSFFK